MDGIEGVTPTDALFMLQGSAVSRYWATDAGGGLNAYGLSPGETAGNCYNNSYNNADFVAMIMRFTGETMSAFINKTNLVWLFGGAQQCRVCLGMVAE
jgi:hypothetical protein